MAHGGISKVGGGNVTVLPPQREAAATSHKSAAPKTPGTAKTQHATTHHPVTVEGQAPSRHTPRGTHLNILV